MKQIDTNSKYECKELCIISVDAEKLGFQRLCVDSKGRYVLHKSYTINQSSGYGESDEYYYLDSEETKLYVKRAQKNKSIKRKQAKEIFRMINENQKNGKIQSFQTITLKLMGMRYTNEFEIIAKDDKAEVSLYNIRYSSGKDERILEKRKMCDLNEFLQLLNECKICSWDGFHGAHPKNVSDGTMFRFDATVNGAQKIFADGSENFPKHFREFTDALNSIINDDLGKD